MHDFENPAGPLDAESLTPLFVPVPQALAEVLGYHGHARFVGMFWSDEADEVVLTDGRQRGVGESLRFLEYLGHRAVELELGDLNVGLFGQPATVWLVLDRLAGNLYFVTSDTAQAFLLRQHVSDVIDNGRIQLREDAKSVVAENDPALDELRAFLTRFLGPNDVK